MPGRRPIQLAAPVFGAGEEAGVLAVLRSGQLAQGPVVEELERLFALEHDSPYAVAVSNGTTALMTALEALRLGPGDEVITSPLTFVATLSAILRVGATAVLVDVDADLCLSPAAVEAAITPRTRAVLPVHLYGLPADLPALSAVAARHGIALVEDAAQAHGARVAGRAVGSFGTGCFSLYATKNIAAGEGGVVTTSDAGVADRLRLLRNHGVREQGRVELIGDNRRLSDLHAAVALPQLRRLREITAARRANAALLTRGLTGVRGLTLPIEPAGRESSFHQYVIQVAEGARLSRDELADELARHDIGTAVYYRRLTHDHPAFRGHPGVRAHPTPAAARATGEVLSLPVRPGLTQSEIAEVVDVVRTALR